MLIKINEIKSSAEATFKNLKNKLQNFNNSKLKDLDEKALGEILKVYAKDLGLNYKTDVFSKKDTEEFITDFVDWFDSSETTGNFIFDFADMVKDGSDKPILSVETIIKLINLDPKMIDTIRRFGIKYKFITPDGREIIGHDPDELDDDKRKSGRPLDFYTLCRYILVDMNSEGVEHLDDLDDFDFTDLNLDHYSDDDKVNLNLYKETLNKLRDMYRGKLTEDVEEDEEELDEIETKDVEDNADKTVDTSIENSVVIDKKIEVVPADNEEDEGIKFAVKDLVNQLITDFWGFISKINSGITTIKLDFNDETKNSLLDILNSVADDLTINVGMLSKASSLLDDKSTKLMSRGEKKADKIIGENDD